VKFLFVVLLLMPLWVQASLVNAFNPDACGVDYPKKPADTSKAPSVVFMAMLWGDKWLCTPWFVNPVRVLKLFRGSLGLGLTIPKMFPMESPIQVMELSLNLNTRRSRLVLPALEFLRANVRGLIVPMIQRNDLSLDLVPPPRTPK